MRRYLIPLVPAVLLAATLSAPTHADTPVQVLDEALPSGWTGTSTAFVRGPDGVSSGAGSVQFESLTDPTDVALTAYDVFDTRINVPAGTSAALVLSWTCCSGQMYTLRASLTPTPGWSHFQLSPGTPVDFYYAGAYQYTEPWSYYEQFGGTILDTTIQLSGGATPRAHIDTLTGPDGTSFDFEPVQQPSIGSSATTITYGQPVTITGSVADGDGVAWTHIAVTLGQQPAGSSTFEVVDEDISSASGRLASQESPTMTTAYRWTSLSGRSSELRTIKVAPAITARIAHTRVASGHRLSVRGVVAPLLPGVSMQLMRSGSKRPIAATPIKRDGSYAFSVRAPRGTYLVWTRSAATSGYVPGTSRQTLVTVS